MKHTTTLVICALLLLGSRLGAFEAVMKMADNGTACADIRLGNDATDVERFAAQELCRYVERVSDAKLPMLRDDAKVKSSRVWIGTAEDGALPPDVAARFRRMTPDIDAYVIQTQGDTLYLVGRNPRGALYAVYDFLSTQLGIRWIEPGPAGEVIPRNRTITVSKTDRFEKPSFQFRGLIGGGRPAVLDWMAKHRLNYAHGGRPPATEEQRREISKRGIISEYGSHNFFRYVPVAEYKDSHPEYFTLYRTPDKPDGERVFDRGLCLSNPDVFKIYVRNLGEYLRAHPEVVRMDMWPEDQASDCECDTCRRIGLFTENYVRFTRCVADWLRREFPERRLSYLAYLQSLVLEEPLPMKLPDNVDVTVAMICGCYRHGFDKSCPINAPHLRYLENWMKSRAGNVIIYDYLIFWGGWVDGAWEGKEYPFPQALQANYRHFARIGVTGVNTQVRGEPWHPQGYDYDVFAQLVWNVDADLEASIASYCRAAFGDAWREMREVYRILEQVMGALDHQSESEVLQALDKETREAYAHDCHQKLRVMADPNVVQKLKERAGLAQTQRFIGQQTASIRKLLATLEPTRALLKSAATIAEDPAQKQRIATIEQNIFDSFHRVIWPDGKRRNKVIKGVWRELQGDLAEFERLQIGHGGRADP